MGKSEKFTSADLGQLLTRLDAPASALFLDPLGPTTRARQGQLLVWSVVLFVVSTAAAEPTEASVGSISLVVGDLGLLVRVVQIVVGFLAMTFAFSAWNDIEAFRHPAAAAVIKIRDEIDRLTAIYNAQVQRLNQLFADIRVAGEVRSEFADEYEAVCERFDQEIGSLVRELSSLPAPTNVDEAKVRDEEARRITARLADLRRDRAAAVAPYWEIINNFDQYDDMRQLSDEATQVARESPILVPAETLNRVVRKFLFLHKTRIVLEIMVPLTLGVLSIVVSIVFAEPSWLPV